MMSDSAKSPKFPWHRILTAHTEVLSVGYSPVYTEATPKNFLPIPHGGPTLYIHWVKVICKWSQIIGKNPASKVAGATNTGDNPRRLHPEIVNPGEEPSSWCAYPGDNPLRSTTESADRDRRRSRLHIYPPPPAPYIKTFAADAKAYSLITRSQLTAAQCLPWFLIKAAWATYSKVKSLHQRPLVKFRFNLSRSLLAPKVLPPYSLSALEAPFG